MFSLGADATFLILSCHGLIYCNVSLMFLVVPMPTKEPFIFKPHKYYISGFAHRIILNRNRIFTADRSKAVLLLQFLFNRLSFIKNALIRRFVISFMFLNSFIFRCICKVWRCFGISTKGKHSAWFNFVL